MIPNEQVQQVREASDIVDVLSQYMDMKRSGSNFKARCPFHEEKTPSFMISPDKQIYKCFGCGESGNVFTFIQKHENVNFVEAVRLLARRAGITLTETGAGAGNKNFDEREKVIAINKDALKFFRQCFEKSETAKKYVSGRGLGAEIINEFMLGYAPDGSALFKELREKGHSEENIVKSWLCKKGEHGYYDIFRNRLVFPIINVYGDPVAFGARVFDNSEPKYINSAETPAYVKGRNLYNLNNARKHKSDTGLIIVEGYMDAIGVYKAGIKNVAASLGTALTHDQAKLMQRHFDRAVIMYDMDEAGINGALRGGEILFECGIDCRVARYDGAKDPDEYASRFGAEALFDVIAKAAPYFDFRASVLREKTDPQNPYQAEKALKELGLVASKSVSPVIRQDCARRMSETFLVPLSVAESYITGGIKAKEQEKPAVKKESTKGAFLAEMLLAQVCVRALLIDDRDIVLKHLFGRRGLDGIEYSDFNSAVYASVIRGAEKLHAEGARDIPGMLMTELQENADAVSFVASELAHGMTDKDNSGEYIAIISDCFMRLKKEKADLKIRELHEMIREAEKAGDLEKVKELLLKKQEIQKNITPRGESFEQES